jgi:PAS domain S-box-containing protein
MEIFTGDAPAASQLSVLDDRRELALVAVERTRMPMVVSDARQDDYPIVLANQAFLNLTGYTAEEVIGRNCRFLQGPKTSPQAIDSIRRGLTADDHFVTVELLNYRKDGSTFWNQLEISPVHDESGQTIYHFASQKGVTAQRRAEELEAIERLLLMEVDHRAMNALALVQSVLNLTRADDISRYSRAVTQRIDAIARVHRILARSSWSGTTLRDLLSEEQSEDRLEMHGPPVKVAPRLAQPLAIVFHELLSNAREHGALSVDNGRAKVSWGICPDKLRLHWSEPRTPHHSPTPEAGLGLSLVQAIIERQLQGSATIDWRKPGLQVDLTVPIQKSDVELQT